MSRVFSKCKFTLFETKLDSQNKRDTSDDKAIHKAIQQEEFETQLSLNERIFLALHWVCRGVQFTGFVILAALPCFLAGFSIIHEFIAGCLTFIILIHGV